MVDALLHLLRTMRFSFTTEMDLQKGIELALQGTGLPYQREHPLGRDRVVDFFLGGVALEVKIEGSLSAVTRQLYRYAEHPDITAVVLATSRMLHCRMPSTMNGKPVHVVVLRTGMF